MTKNKILALIKKNACEVLPELDEDKFQPNVSLRDLGADSVDRAEILNMTLEDMNLHVPRTKFFAPNNIGELCTLLHKQLDEA